VTTKLLKCEALSWHSTQKLFVFLVSPMILFNAKNRKKFFSETFLLNIGFLSIMISVYEREREEENRTNIASKKALQQLIKNNLRQYK